MGHIEIIAGVGAGKTTLGHALAQQGFAFSPEEFEKNPFLTPFHKDPWSCAFEFGMTMLALHFNQLNMQPQPTIPSIFDFSLVTNEAYARSYADFKLMKPALAQSYIEAARTARNESVKPALRIMLELPSGVQMERIRKRGRELEKEDRTSQPFIETLNRHIAAITSELNDNLPLLRLDAVHYDWVNNPADSQKIASMIRAAAGL